jgi:predicted DNA-binding ribbon-helix-helix protein
LEGRHADNRGAGSVNRVRRQASVVGHLGGAPERRAARGSTLVNRNVFIGTRRTSLRLEPAMWDALAEICRREDMSLHAICGLIDERRQASSLTAAIRVFIVTYFRSAATEEGHASIGHGPLLAPQRRVKVSTPHRRQGCEST